MKKINWGTWDLWRSTRLILGLGFSVYGILKSDFVLAAAGVFLIVHAYINSCAACASGSCEVPKQTENGKI